MPVCQLCGEYEPTDAVDLVAVFGRKYELGFDADESARRTCPWHSVIRCRAGDISPASKDHLWVSADTRAASSRLRQLAATDERVELRQDGDDGVSVMVHVDNFGLVAPIMKPIKKAR